MLDVLRIASLRDTLQMPDSNANSQTPEGSYRVRLALRTTEIRMLSRRLSRFAWYKLALIGVVVGYAVFDSVSALLLMPLFVMFVPVVIVQNRIRRRLDRVYRANEFHRHALRSQQSAGDQVISELVGRQRNA
jgi:Flp pilus assembly protein TadB